MTGPEFDRRAADAAAIRLILFRFAAWAGQAAAMALISRARLLGELSPFAPACFAAGFAGGWSPAAMLIGCAAGALITGGMQIDLLPLISCAAVCAIQFILRLIRSRYPEMDGMRDFLVGVTAGASLLVPGLILSGGIMYNILTAILGAAVACFLAPALISAAGIRADRRLLMPEEQLSLALLAMILLMGLRALPFAGKALSAMAAAGLTLLCSGAGSGMGALAGLAAGTALTIGGSDPFMGSVLGLCGLLAGCVKGLPRIGACAAMLFGNMLTVSWGVGYTIGAVDAAPMLAACALYCLIPAHSLKRLRSWMKPAYPHADPEGIAVRMRRKAGRRLGEISEIFGELADGYGEKTVLPGEQQIISEVRHALCDGCEGYAECWMGDSARAGRLMCRMAAEALGGREITQAKELPPDLIRHCRRSGQIDRRAVPLLSRLAQERREALKRGEAKGLIGRQFREAQRMLDSLATQMKSGVCVNREYAGLVHAALDRAGIRAREVTAILDDRLEIVCVLKEKIWDSKAARHAAALLSDELGIPFSPVLSRGRVPGECELRLQQAPALTAEIGAATCAAEEGAACGDSHIVCILPDGRLIAAISDGMGHGEEAAAESRRCISLLRKFVSAGIDRDAALTAVNSLLMMKSGEDMFATADLCVADLYSGIASFSKLGACRSYIVGERGICEIAGGRLPLGILDRVEPASEKAEVHPGDILIMVSDGIADEMKEGQTKALKGMLKGIRRMKPEKAAESILEWAKKRDAGKKRDDMTVIAVRILARRIRTIG